MRCALQVAVEKRRRAEEAEARARQHEDRRAAEDAEDRTAAQQRALELRNAVAYHREGGRSDELCTARQSNILFQPLSEFCDGVALSATEECPSLNSLCVLVSPC